VPAGAVSGVEAAAPALRRARQKPRVASASSMPSISSSDRLLGP
jgi:hypothetical protein